VQIPFHLPALAVDDLADFIKALNPNLSERTQAVLARGVCPNPRQVKRTLNIMRLLRGVANSRFKGEAGAQIADPLLAKTVIIQSQYPRLYQLWRQYPTLVQTLETAYAQRPSNEEELLTGVRRAAARKPSAPETGGGATPLSTGEEGTPPVAASPTSGATDGGELGEYLHNRAKYLLLERLLTYPPEAETGSGADRARFSGLTRPQVEAYVRLAGAVENDPVPLDAPTDLMDDLLSGEAIKIGDAAGRVAADETEADGPLRQAVQRQLVTVLSDPQRPTKQRLSAGDALGHVGDSRFHKADGFFLPDEPLLGFVEIPAGQFRMGSDPEQDSQAEKAEQPQHSLHLEQFFMARYPVTMAQFKLFVEQTKHKPSDADSLKGLPNHPARYVSWHDAVACCQWLTKALRSWSQTPTALQLENGWSVNLPSEAEWEKAARSADARLYPWGNEFDPDKANHKGTGINNVSVVGCFPAGVSANGLLDMSGNVWEWTRSAWREYPYKANDEREDSSKGSELGIVLRGGSAWNEPQYMRCAFRLRHFPADHFRHFGFRVCVSPFLSPL
jgi:formylglycine-generating enzyme required for sulfatase activity